MEISLNRFGPTKSEQETTNHAKYTYYCLNVPPPVNVVTSVNIQVARKERDSYAGLSSYRPPPTINVRSGTPAVSTARDREAKYGTNTTGGGASVVSSTRAKYPRSYSSERTPSSESELTSPLKEKSSGSGSFRASRYSGGTAYTPPETPTLRMGSSARFGGQIARSPLTDKSPTVFGVSGPLDFQHAKREDKMVLVTRSTSPTPPCNSSFLRAKRADMEATVTAEVPRPHFRPHCVSAHVQADEREAARAAALSPTPQTPARLSSWAASRISSLSTVSATPRYSPRIPTYSPTYSRPTDLPLRTSSYRSETKTDDAKPKDRLEPPKPKSPVPPPDTKREEAVNKSTSAAGLKKSKSTKILPPPSPKAEPVQRNCVINKDFRKSTLNMDLSSSGESLNKSTSKTNLSKSKSKIKVSSSPPPKVTLDLPKSGKIPQIARNISVSESDSSSEEEESTTDSSDTSDECSDNDRGKGQNPTAVSAKSSTQLSSADEGKPPKPPLSPRASRKAEGSKPEETKSVVVRALCVSGPMKVKYPGASSSGEEKKPGSKGSSSEGDESINQALRASSKDVPAKIYKSSSKKKIVENAEVVPEDVFVQSNNFTPGLNRIHQKVLQDQRAYPLTTMYKIRKMDSGERAWWMESTNDVPALANDLKKDKSSKSISGIPKDKSAKSTPSLQKDKSSKSIPGLQKDNSSKSIPALQKPKDSLQVPGQKENQDPGLKKTTSLKSIPGLQRVASNSSLGQLQRNGSCKSLPRSESRKSLQGSESSCSDVAATESRYYATRAPNYRICRMESGDREWWLDKDEKSTTSSNKLKKKEGQVFVGTFVNIDHVLGTLAPPPGALRTPRDTASEDSDSGDESACKMAADDVKIHDSAAKNSFISPQRGMIKAELWGIGTEIVVFVKSTSQVPELVLAKFLQSITILCCCPDMSTVVLLSMGGLLESPNTHLGLCSGPPPPLTLWVAVELSPTKTLSEAYTRMTPQESTRCLLFRSESGTE
ncbi:hypothetical protein AAG570_004294 [Ranatra chinensis]|uniref:Uncharacterized protein n=1 Tax=Ranatra chinensis TaxID=642074 RepID=A0ABD0Y0I1_9HEMI